MVSDGVRTAIGLFIASVLLVLGISMFQVAEIDYFSDSGDRILHPLAGLALPILGIGFVLIVLTTWHMSRTEPEPVESAVR